VSADPRGSAAARRAALEAWLRVRARAVTAVLVGAAVFVRLLLCLQVAAGPLPRVHEIVEGSDNGFFDAWGRRVAAGDLLQAAPFHPMPAWMRHVSREVLAADPAVPVRLGLAPDAGYDPAAMEGRLWDHWLGGATWFQEPAYAYLVGLTYRVTGPDPWHVFAWQLALGVAGVWLVVRLGRRLFSHAAGAAAGALAVLAPVPLFYEVTLLRDALVVVVTLALALLVHAAPGAGRRGWLGLGVAFGAAALLKQSFLFFPAAMMAWRVAAVRAPLRARLEAAGLVAAGMAAALLPAVARNLAVGVPPLAMNGSAAGMLAVFHSANASPWDLTLTPEFPRILVASGGRPLAALAEAARTHADGWGGMLLLELRKLAYAWHGFESPNNVDFYLFRQGAPVLAWLPATFVVLLPLAAVGLASRRALEAWPLLVAVAASVPTLVLAVVLSRYRAPITAALLPLAGAGVVRIAEWIAARRGVPLGAAAALAAAYLAWATGSPAGKEPPARALAYARAGVGALERHEPEYAALNLQEALRLQPGAPQVEARLGQALLAAGDPAGALPHVEAAARSLDSARMHELHAEVLAALGRADEALAQARAALAKDPGRPTARALLDRLERRSGER
jgi:4-amino-4-deoxy-L-arabinose transferase-like glycosyltransferase